MTNPPAAARRTLHTVEADTSPSGDPISRCGAAEFECCGCFSPGEHLRCDGAECSGVVWSQRLRGLPATGRNVRGSIRGTDPVSETIRRAERHGL